MTTRQTNGLLQFVTDALPPPDGPNSTEYDFDDGGRLTCVTDAEGNRTAFEYDEQNSIRFVHDAENTVSQSSNCLFPPTGAPTEYRYDAKGNRTSVINALGKETTFVYDDMSRLISTTNPNRQPVGPPETGAQCGAAGNGDGVDDDGDMVKDDGCPSTSYTYYANGNLKTRTDARKPNRTVTNVYDVLDRLSDIQYPDEDYSVQFAYFDDGLRQTMTDNCGTTSYQYFDDHSLKQVTDPQTNVIKYQYDDVGNRTKITYPDLKEVDYDYDEFNRMETVTDWLGNVTRYDYDDAGNLDITTTDLFGAADDLIADRDYDAADRLTLLTNKLDTATLSSDAYDDLDGVGNRLLVTDNTGGVTNYLYDDLYRLTDVTYPETDTADYEYDPVGNRTKLTPSGGGVTSYHYDDADQLTRLCPAATCASSTAGTEYGYEGNGSVVYFGENDFAGDPAAQDLAILANQFPLMDYEAQYLRVGHCLDQFVNDVSFDGNVNIIDIGLLTQAFDRPEEEPGGGLYDPRKDLNPAGPDGFINIIDIGAVVLQFTQECPDTGHFFYNGDGLRVQKWAGRLPMEKTDYVWDVGAALPVVLEETVTEDPAGTPTVTTFYYVYGLDLIARVELDAGGDIDSYYLYDGLGSTTGLTDGVGAVPDDTYRYDSFGALRGGTGTSEQPFRFTGEHQDPDVANDLYYLQARYYNPKPGRFWTEDPIAGGNPYPYVTNNPVNLVDPSGECPWCVGVVACAISSDCRSDVKDWAQAVIDHPGSIVQDTIGGAFAITSSGDRRHDDGATFYENCRGSCWVFRLVPNANTITIGHFVFGRGSIGSEVECHERVHIQRGDRYGPTWIPRYFGELRRGYGSNRFEQEWEVQPRAAGDV